MAWSTSKAFPETRTSGFLTASLSTQCLTLLTSTHVTILTVWRWVSVMPTTTWRSVTEDSKTSIASTYKLVCDLLHSAVDVVFVT